MGCNSSKAKIREKKNLENKVSAFYSVNKTPNTQFESIMRDDVVTPLGIQDNFDILEANSKSKKNLELENFILEKENIIADKNKPNLKRKLYESSADMIEHIYRPKRFDLDEKMFEHKNIEIFCLEKIEKTYIDLSKKYFNYLEFKVTKDTIIPLKIPVHFKEIITQDLCNISFNDFKMRLDKEIENFAKNLHKKNIYKEEIEKINEGNFFEKIIFLYSLEGFWYTKINEILKEVNLCDFDFDINNCDIGPELNSGNLAQNFFIQMGEINEKFISKNQKNNDANKTLKEKYKSRKNQKNKSNHDKSLRKSNKNLNQEILGIGSKFKEEKNKGTQKLKNVNMQNKKILSEIDDILKNEMDYINADDGVFTKIELKEEIEEIIKKSYKFGEEEKKNGEINLQEEKEEDVKLTKIDNYQNDYQESSDNYDENDEDQFIEGNNAKPAEIDENLDNSKGKMIKAKVKAKNVSANSIEKLGNLKFEIDKLKYSYIGIMAAVTFFSMDEKNRIFTEDDLKIAKKDKPDDIKIYKYQYLSKEKIESLKEKKNQIRIYNEFISFYKMRNYAERNVDSKKEECEARGELKVCLELKILKNFNDLYYEKSKIFNKEESGQDKSIKKLDFDENLHKKHNSSEFYNLSLIKNNSNFNNNMNLENIKSDLLIENIEKIDKNKNSSSNVAFRNNAYFNQSFYDENYYLNMFSLVNAEKFSFFKNEREIILNSGSMIIIEDVVEISDKSYEIKANLVNFSFLSFCLILHLFPKVDYFNISFNSLGKNKIFSNFLKKNLSIQNFSELTEIDLTNNKFGEFENSGFIPLSKYLIANKSLHVLNLEYNFFGKSKENMKNLGEVIKKPNCSIIQLNLSNNFLGEDEKVFEILAEALGKNTSVEILNFSNNSFSNNIKSFLALNEFLNKNQKIIELDLSNNSIGENPNNGKMLAYAITSSQTLLKVDLSGNKLGGNNIIFDAMESKSSMPFLSEIFLFNNKLQDINLSDNNIGENPKNLEVFFKNLLMNSTVKKLNLGKNKLGNNETNFKFLRNFLLKNHSVEELHLNSNNISENEMPILISGLKKSRNFHLINLEDNDLNGYEKFNKFVEENKDTANFMAIKF